MIQAEQSAVYPFRDNFVNLDGHSSKICLRKTKVISETFSECVKKHWIEPYHHNHNPHFTSRFSRVSLLLTRKSMVSNNSSVLVKPEMKPALSKYDDWNNRMSNES